MKPGDRVRVYDPGLEAIQRIFDEAGGKSRFRNDEGTIESIRDGIAYINFDNDDGPGQGAQAPYPLADVRAITEAAP